MTGVSDAVVIGVVLGLVFAAVNYYLFTRVSQLERKVGLMENILLDLKVTTEQTLLSATEPHEHDNPPTADLNTYRHVVQQTVQEDDETIGASQKTVQIRPFEDAEESAVQEKEQGQESQGGESRELFVESVPRARTPQQPVQVERDAPAVSVNYEAMTYKELVNYAKQKGLTGLRNLSKKEVIDVLRRRDGGGGGASATADVSDLSTWKNTTVSFGEGDLQPLNDGANTAEIDGVGSFGGTMLGATPLEETTEVEASLVQSSD